MTHILLDTDVFSFIFKGDTRADFYVPHTVNTQPCLCFQSVAELRLWAIVRNGGETRRAQLDGAIARCLVLPYDDLMSRRWAEITAHRRTLGQSIDCGDAWIAASALRHDMALLTHNGKHYAGIMGLRLVSKEAK
ncbi:MAG: type II toxin-antitoxin system VapC family toxin [Phycisphaeraceae bacterium]